MSSLKHPSLSASDNTDTTPDASGWSANLYNQVASFVYSSQYTTPILDLLDAKPGERIIDFGCGSGDLTLSIEKVVTQGQGGVVVGVDASESMISKAKSNGLKHAFVADLTKPLVFPSSEQEFHGPTGNFDAVFANAALHWCKSDPSAAVENAKRVLKKGGRFVAEMGGYLNCAGIRIALHAVLRRRGYNPEEMDPWYFPHDLEYRKLLESHGFEVLSCTLHPRITPVPAGLKGWMSIFVRSTWLKNLADEEAESVMGEVEDMCKVDLHYGDGKDEGWEVMYVRLRFAAKLA
ncbi:S-adenosyl-L-methionine-dependent methyltransferase [Dendrothele bispora CBS 962.96]|uniref:S-adenosyl-L-methionine-dependent methyltransferase n=1 Tax=Dendrothele bispora (strain CBS 962.96) TaxID=1314807 RepID=A0A4S8MGV7_DENBC|nr:S-adenosyl-L-methionine-dependent methyltransferase [Dendrothele bispora CBS 962.96]